MSIRPERNRRKATNLKDSARRLLWAHRMIVRTHLDDLENQSIFIFREAYQAFKNICMQWSMGKGPIDKTIHPTKQSLSL